MPSSLAVRASESAHSDDWTRQGGKLDHKQFAQFEKRGVKTEVSPRRRLAPRRRLCFDATAATAAADPSHNAGLWEMDHHPGNSGFFREYRPHRLLDASVHACMHACV